MTSAHVIFSKSSPAFQMTQFAALSLNLGAADVIYFPCIFLTMSTPRSSLEAPALERQRARVQER